MTKNVVFNKVRVAKSGPSYSITIPIVYIRNKLVDPDEEYDVILVPRTIKKKGVCAA